MVDEAILFYLAFLHMAIIIEIKLGVHKLQIKLWLPNKQRCERLAYKSASSGQECVKHNLHRPISFLFLCLFLYATYCTIRECTCIIFLKTTPHVILQCTPNNIPSDINVENSYCVYIGLGLRQRLLKEGRKLVRPVVSVLYRLKWYTV